ncbi:TonB-dependent receptor [uncultured Hyphomonas sp.]|uniref:TonB-dependent siderophore receptor n=1 Tax=uncultured Hyphomonas sp. TaxID=225298 RepID=UPI002AAC21DA|nr:TonB-dependent receptor [uncultured Hyphomonas sp.]
MVKTKFHFRHMLLCTAAGLIISSSALADEPTFETSEIRIQSQSLETAINDLAAQTGTVIVVPGALTSGIRSGTVTGTMTPVEALARLLQGTQLTYTIDEQGAIIVSKAEARGSSGDAASLEDTAGDDGSDVAMLGTVTVTGTRLDPLNQLQKGATDSLTGLSLSLLETPRAASRVSEITIDRYGMEDVDDLLSAVPGTFTASFFGVPGNLNVRGTLADTYFQGFKRIENRGNYSSNLSAASYVEVLRGPASPIYGPGKVGGLLNFIPKTARGEKTDYVDTVSGSVTGTYGSYDKKVLAGELYIPAGRGGFSIFGEREDSGSYYDNIDPEHTNLQGTYVGDLNDDWSVELNAMYFEESGRIQVPGWNRVTQDLIDNGTYITGWDTDIQDTDGDGYLSYEEIDSAVGAYYGTSNIRQIAEYYGAPLPEFALDEGVGTTKLDGSNILAAKGDYNDTNTFTAYAGLERSIGETGTLKFQAFVDKMENQRFNSFGFAADYEAQAEELRASYGFKKDFGTILTTDNVVGIGYRHHDAKQYETFLSGYIASDRRDLSVGAQANDRIMAIRFDEDGTPLWDSRYDMEWSSRSAFAVSDMKLYDRLALLLGWRYDYYEAEAINTGETVYGIADELVEDSDGAQSWSVALRYETPYGITPYITYADSRSLESTQTGGLSTGTINANLFISPSELKEAGAKFSVLNGNLFGGLAYYEQFRRQTDMLGNVDGTTAKGFELEVHWLASDNLSFAASFTDQETKVDAPGAGKGEYLQVRPDQFGVDNVLGYGGTFAFNNAGYVAELADGYAIKTIPDNVASLYGTYTSDRFEMAGMDAQAGATLGATYVSETGGIFPDDIVLPSYTLANGAAFLEIGNVTVSANVDNILDERYFTPSAEVYKEVAVMPGLPRTYKLTVKYRF